MSYTRGPWKDGKTSDSIIAPKANQDELGAATYHTWKFYGGYVIAESVAPHNKPLIKAAPDLLEICEKVLPLIHQAWAALDHSYYEDLISKLGDTEDKIKALVAKAKGEK